MIFQQAELEQLPVSWMNYLVPKVLGVSTGDWVLPSCFYYFFKQGPDRQIKPLQGGIGRWGWLGEGVIENKEKQEQKERQTLVSKLGWERLFYSAEKC